MFDKRICHMYNCKGVFRKEDFMLIDLNEILTETGKEKRYSLDIEMDAFVMGSSTYDFKGEKKVTFVFVNKGKKEISLDCTIDAVLLIPCDRCLEFVKVPFHLHVSKDIDLKKTTEEREAELDEYYFLQGMNFDTEVFVRDEILVNLPMKVLCKDDCKGICNKCGTNLNKGSCDCDTTELDPRMSKVLDVFNQFKEV